MSVLPTNALPSIISIISRLFRDVILLVYFVFGLGVCSVHAAGVVFSDDFEFGIGGWFADNGVWQVGITTAGPANCPSGIGTQCAGTNLGGDYPPDTDSRLISPVVLLPALLASEEIHLRFQHWFSYSVSDSGQVQVSVWDATTSTWGAWVTEGTAVVDTSGWSTKDVDLTAYAGETVRIAFYHSALDHFGTGGLDASTGWYIDDVQIESGTPAFSGDFETGWGDWGADRGVWQVGAPTAGPTACVAGSQCAGTMLGGNYGANTDSRLVSATMALPPAVGNEEVHLRFQQWFSYSVSDSGRVQISVWDATTSTWGAWVTEGTAVADTSGWSTKDVDLTAYAGETVRIAFYHSALNHFGTGGLDVSTGWYIDDVQIVSGAPAFSGDFETGWGDWGADRGVWQVGAPTAGPVTCATGSQCAGTMLGGNYGANTDSRLVSATMALPPAVGNEEVHLSFQQWFSYSVSDSGRVQISVWDATTSTWAAWVTEGTAVADTSGWSTKDVDLTAYAGETVRIAFYHSALNHFGTGGLDVSTGWYIDDVQIVSGAPAFSGDFETGWGDWGADRGVWQVGAPTAGPVTCATGSQCAGTMLGGNYGANTDSRLVSATMSLPVSNGGVGIHLRFQHWFSYSVSDSGQVQASVWDATTSAWGAWVNEGAAVLNSSGWSTKDVDLTAYAGETVRIAFYHSALDHFGTGGLDVSTGWYIDDISIIADTDGDFVSDNLDNCTLVANTNQRDTDGDGYGNLCDGDLNNDGSTNTLDLNLYKLAHRTAFDEDNYNQNADFNGDGLINTIDLNIYKGLHRKPPGPSCCGLF